MDVTEKNTPSGIIQIILGGLITSPLFYNTEEVTSNGIGLSMVGIGVILFITGLVKLSYKTKLKRDLKTSERLLVPSDKSTPDLADDTLSKDHHSDTTFGAFNTYSQTPPVDLKKHNTDTPNPVTIFGELLIKLAYIVLTLTILLTLYMAFFISSGGASGVPIGVGLMVAGIVYGIGKSC